MRKIIGFIVILFLLFPACTETIDTEKEQIPVQPVKKDPTKVKIRFNLQAEFPEGAITPDAVYMDGKVIKDNTSVLTGEHDFVVERQGYEKKEIRIDVVDLGDGNFDLSFILKTKKRLVRFNITDIKTGKLLTPDVTLATIPEGEEEKISDQSLVKPGTKKLVIQLHGYEPLAKTITIEADEAPYILDYKLKPKKD